MTRILAALLLLFVAVPAAAEPMAIAVRLAPGVGQPISGRLIIFATLADPKADPAAPIDSSPFSPTSTALAAREVRALAPGQIALVDLDSDAFPKGFSQLPPGRYRFQAVLDRNHDYNYGGRGAGDIVSPVAEAQLPGAPPELVLASVLPDRPPHDLVADMPAALRPMMQKALDTLVPIDFVSPRLSAFWARPIHMRGWVALPPDYEAHGTKTWPVVYSTGGFSSDLESERQTAISYAVGMISGALPPMIYVLLDESSATGTHEFADSINNGPWGAALTGELIPWLERTYRMDARASGRFLTGHSSGGWATLWLQTRYPKIFGGTWSTSPDSSDFHDFTGIDIYAANADAYVDAGARPIPLVRMGGRDIATIRDFVGIEDVFGPYGGQFASFDWVFSPRGPDGRPMQLFDHATGKIDPVVAAYWRDNYDIAYRIARDWTALKPDLDGKIHVIIGTVDTFHLEGGAHHLQAVLDRLGAHSSFMFRPGRSHFDLFELNGDPDWLTKKIAWDMYAVARPGAPRPEIAAGP